MKVSSKIVQLFQRLAGTNTQINRQKILKMIFWDSYRVYIYMHLVKNGYFIIYLLLHSDTPISFICIHDDIDGVGHNNVG